MTFMMTVQHVRERDEGRVVDFDAEFYRVCVQLSDGTSPRSGKLRPPVASARLRFLGLVTDEAPALMDLRKDRADRVIAVPPPPDGSIL